MPASDVCDDRYAQPAERVENGFLLGEGLALGSDCAADMPGDDCANEEPAGIATTSSQVKTCPGPRYGARGDTTAWISMVISSAAQAVAEALTCEAPSIQVPITTSYPR
jgi:hypothetical protein